jgi:hypothetical protein
MARSKAPPPQPRARQPRHLPDTQAAKAAREARLAEEMRKNLQKRKARQRALQEQGKPD